MIDEDQPLGFAEIRGPADYSDEEIAALGVPAIVANCEFVYGFNYKRLLCISVGAAQMSKDATTSKQDHLQLLAVMQTALRGCKANEAGLSAWCDRLGDRTSVKMKLLLEGFGHLSADIHDALQGLLPDQASPIEIDPDDDDDKEPWQQQ